MIELAMICLMFLAALLMYSSDPRVGRQLLDTLLTAASARTLALAITAFALWLWSRFEPGPSAFLAVTVAAMVGAILCALLAPLARAVLWVSAALSITLVVTCLTLGGVP